MLQQLTMRIQALERKDTLDEDQQHLLRQYRLDLAKVLALLMPEQENH